MTQPGSVPPTRGAASANVEPDEPALPDGRGPRRELETTAALLEVAKAGDAAAVERLVKRFLPALRRWAHGRLPNRARGMVDTDDLVQIALVRALHRIDVFEPQGPGAFLAYLRRIVLNSLRDELRRSSRRPNGEVLVDDVADAAPPPIERIIGEEALEAYESALATLTEAQQEAVMLRVELGFSYQQIAEALGSPSANAARMTVARALVRLAEVMHVRR
jgi:RNA polymerase sigma-70 factor (ECF subfamily)